MFAPERLEFDPPRTNCADRPVDRRGVDLLERRGNAWQLPAIGTLVSAGVAFGTNRGCGPMTIALGETKIDQFTWNGSDRASSRECADVRVQLLSFMAQHVYTCTAEDAQLQASQICVRNRSVKGFTMTRAISTTSGSHLLRRDAAAIASDGRDHYALHMALSGDVIVSQLGREHLLRPGSYTFFSASEPVSHSAVGGGETIYFLMPRAYVNRRLVSGKDICLEPHGDDHGLQKLAFETVLAFQGTASNISDDEFEKTAHIVGGLVLLALGSSA